MSAAKSGFVDRRTFNAGLIAGGTALTMEGIGAAEALAEPVTSGATSSHAMPTIFIAHGSPELAVDPVRGAPFVRWGKELPTPKAILVVSAHWEKRGR